MNLTNGVSYVRDIGKVFKYYHRSNLIIINLLINKKLEIYLMKKKIK